ncbi:MAG: LPS export ABC transporter permease LptG [Acidobacteria bacterium]|nr:LPS export ABC transporter permease LptG [Acidobacteriota bacterium]
MRLLDRYILKEVVAPCFLGFVVYTFTMVMDQILNLSELLVRKGATLSDVAHILLYFLPGITAFTLPMSVLVGLLIGLGRLSTDMEIVAMRASGISLYRLLRPVVLFCGAGWLLSSGLSLYLAPWSNYRLMQILYRVAFTQAKEQIKPRVFNESIPNYVIYIQDIPATGESWKGVFICETQKPENPRIILAREGRFQINMEKRQAYVELKDGITHSFSRSSTNPENYEMTKFESSAEEVDASSLFPQVEVQKRDREKDIRELFSSIREREPKREPTRSLWIEVHKKFALPFSCIVFGLLGLPLGIVNKKGGKSTGFVLSIGIILYYYILITTGEKFAEEGKIAPFLAIWAANITLAVAGLIFLVHSARERSFWGFLRRRAAEVPGPAAATLRRAASNGRSGGIVLRVPRIFIKFPNILDRYILRRFGFIFAMTFSSLAMLFAIITFFELIDDALDNHKPLYLILKYIYYYLPQMLFYMQPVAVLIATLVAFGLLSKTSEVTAMKACGLSLYRISLPVILAAATLSGAAFYIQDYVLPRANRKANALRNEIQNRPVQTYYQLNRTWMRGLGNRIFNYNYYDSERERFNQLSVFDFDPEEFTLVRRISAVNASWRGNQWLLDKVWTREFKKGQTSGFKIIPRMTIDLPETPGYFFKEQKMPDQMKYLELKNYVSELALSGFDTVKFRVQLAQKLSFPLVSLIMAILAVPFSFMMGRRGALYGIGVSVGLAMVFWGTLGVFRSLGYVQVLPSFLAAWSPNIIFAIVGLYMLFTVKT